MKSSTLSRSEAARLTAMRRRLISAHGETTASDLASGLGWYDRAQAAAVALDPDNPARAIGVIAALSPRCQWSTNLAWAARVLAAADAGEPCPRVHTTAMRAQAWRIAQGAPWQTVLRGPKVRAFAANIGGDPTPVTVDVWAARAAEGRSDPRSPSGRRYALIERAYQEAAAILGLSPRDLQAAVWVHVRGSAD